MIRMRTNRVMRVLVVSGLIAGGMMVGGCTKRPSEEELAKLEETRQAADAAEQKLAELRRERMELESVLQEKQAELQRHEEERDDLQMKMDQR